MLIISFVLALLQAHSVHTYGMQAHTQHITVYKSVQLEVEFEQRFIHASFQVTRMQKAVWCKWFAGQGASALYA